MTSIWEGVEAWLAQKIDARFIERRWVRSIYRPIVNVTGVGERNGPAGQKGYVSVETPISTTATTGKTEIHTGLSTHVHTHFSKLASALKIA